MPNARTRVAAAARPLLGVLLLLLIPLASHGTSFLYQYSGATNRFGDPNDPTVPAAAIPISMNFWMSSLLPANFGGTLVSNTANQIDGWSISDGANSQDASTGWTLTNLSVQTDANGQIDRWSFEARNPALGGIVGEVADLQEGDHVRIASTINLSGILTTDTTGYCAGVGSVSDPAGTGQQVWACTEKVAFADYSLTNPMGPQPGWTVSAVPLPGAVWLFLSALAGLAALRTRRVGFRTRGVPALQ